MSGNESATPHLQQVDHSFDPPPPYSGEPVKQPFPQHLPQSGFQPAPSGPYPTGPPPMATMTTVIMTPMVAMSPNPVSMQCTSCNAQIVTEINFITGTLTWIVCIVLLLFGLWCGCCLIPFCIPECQDVEHRCPNCKRVLGVYRRV